MNELEEIQKWYMSQCNEAWEHANGVRIETLDNPGWLVHIDLVGTPLQSKAFKTVIQERSESEDRNDWINCQVEEGQYVGAGGPANLAKILSVFLDWAKP